MRMQFLRRGLATIAWLVAASHAGATSGVGLNVGEWGYWSPDLPTIDQFKRATGWFTQCARAQGLPDRNDNCPQDWAWDTGEQSKLMLDAQGWVTQLPAANDTNTQYRWVAALLFQNNGGAHPAGDYTVLYDGAGVVEYGLLGSLVQQGNGRDIVRVRSGNDGLLIRIRATTPGNPVRNIRVLPPGGVCDGAPKVYAESQSACTTRGTGTLVPFETLVAQQPQTWHPAFIADLKGFRTVRFLDWGKTNSSALKNWADRPRNVQAFWTGPSGIPVEAMVELANRADADPWINLPMQASDDYARRFARVVKERLNATHTLILEYSNEPWNGAFPAYGYMQDQALQKWPPPVKGQLDPDRFSKAMSWYGLRSVQLCGIVKAEFGADAARVRCVANGQAAAKDVTRLILDCPFAKQSLGQACGRRLDALAVAPYFGGYIGDLGADGIVRRTVDGWTADADGGLNKLFAEILAEGPDGGSATPPLYGIHPESEPGGALEKTRRWMQESFGVATEFGLPVWTYEGGQHLTPANAADQDPAWIGLYTRANRDPRMARAYERWLQAWRGAGGQTATLFNHVYRPGPGGAWGLKETQFTTEGVKWNAVLPWRDGVCWWPACGQ